MQNPLLRSHVLHVSGLSLFAAYYTSCEVLQNTLGTVPSVFHMLSARLNFLWVPETRLEDKISIAILNLNSHYSLKVNKKCYSLRIMKIVLKFLFCDSEFQKIYQQEKNYISVFIQTYINSHSKLETDWVIHLKKKIVFRCQWKNARLLEP